MEAKKYKNQQLSSRGILCQVCKKKNLVENMYRMADEDCQKCDDF